MIAETLLRHALVTCLAFGAGAPPDPATPQQGAVGLPPIAAVSVIVTGPDGRPLHGAIVVLSGPDGDRKASSDFGVYKFQELAAGTYHVRIERKGERPFVAGDLKLGPRDNTFFEVDLRKKPSPPPPAAPTTPPPSPKPPAAPVQPPPTPAPPPKSAADPSKTSKNSPTPPTIPAGMTSPPKPVATSPEKPPTPPTPVTTEPVPVPDPPPAQVPMPAHRLGTARTSRISDDSVVRLDVEHYPKRPKPLLEIGPRFLGNGNLPRGWELPGGAVWTPQLIAFGTMSSALQGTQAQATRARTEEWSNRLDLFANLQLSGTERLLVGFRPLDDDLGATGYNFTPGTIDRTDDRRNHHVRTMFFQGDVGEIFPNMDRADRGRWDIGFSVGRQPLSFQDGLLINDTIDAVGVTRNTIIPHGGSNLQLTGLYGWNGLHGSNNAARADVELVGAVMTADIGRSSMNSEFFFVRDRAGDDDGAYWAVSRTRRMGQVNTTIRLLGSYALHEIARPTVPVVGTGYMLFGEASRTPPWTHDLFYVTGFVAAGNFTSVARAPGTGGPLGRAGILFASPGFGRYGSPLSNRARDVAGGAIGYQKLIGALGRRQFVFEADGRASRNQADETAIAGGSRYQQAFGRHFVVQFDGYAKYARFAARRAGFGARIESRIEF